MKNVKTKLGQLFFFTAFALFVTSCGGSKQEETEEATEETSAAEAVMNEPSSEMDEPVVLEEAPIICLWSKVSIKETPSSKGKWVTYIYLGESATYKGITVKDTTVAKGKDYASVELIDGTEGWVDTRFMAIDAKPYVIKELSKLYKRPVLLASSDKEYARMQFVVVLEEKDDWIKVRAKRSEDSWFTEGWIKASHVSSDQTDINVAILTARALENKDEEARKKALEDIINNNDLNSSGFISDIQEMLVEQPVEETDSTATIEN